LDDVRVSVDQETIYLETELTLLDSRKTREPETESSKTFLNNYLV